MAAVSCFARGDSLKLKSEVQRAGSQAVASPNSQPGDTTTERHYKRDGILIISSITTLEEVYVMSSLIQGSRDGARSDHEKKFRMRVTAIVLLLLLLLVGLLRWVRRDGI